MENKRPTIQDDMNELLDEIERLKLENEKLKKELTQVKCGCMTGCPDCTMPCNGGVDLYD